MVPVPVQTRWQDNALRLADIQQAVQIIKKAAAAIIGFPPGIGIVKCRLPRRVVGLAGDGGGKRDVVVLVKKAV